MGKRFYTTHARNTTQMDDHDDGHEADADRPQTVQELSQEVKNQPAAIKKGFRVPIVFALLAQLIIAVTVVAVPLSYISFNNASKITNDLTVTIINSTIQQTSDRLLSFFTQFSNSVTTVASYPQVPYQQDCCINDMSANNVNLTMQIIRLLQQNPLTAALQVQFHSNISNLINNDGVKYMVLQNPCSLYNLPIPGVCYVRARADAATNAALVGRLLDPTTGLDISPDIILIPSGYVPVPQIYKSWDANETEPGWTILYALGTFTQYYVLFGKAYTHFGADGRVHTNVGAGFTSCEAKLVQFFNDLLPTSGSTIFLVDDTGYMVASTINGTSSLNETRYSPVGNPSSLISSVSQYIENTYAPFAQPANVPNQTTQIVVAGGSSYILATKTIYLPVTFQRYQLVLIVPRSGFYGSTDNAFRLAIIIGLAIAGGGLVVVGALSHLASLPLKRLSRAMARLTKFDFTVLENGNLDHRSMISELQEVEQTFLMMVMAFAAGIRRNKELLLARSGGSSSGNIQYSPGRI